jgi:hypothetical protein
LILPNAAIVAGSPAVVIAKTAAWRIAARSMPSASALRVCDSDAALGLLADRDPELDEPPVPLGQGTGRMRRVSEPRERLHHAGGGNDNSTWPHRDDPIWPHPRR